jgi:phage-related holin
MKKEMVCTITGAVGGAIASFFGGWDSALYTLIIFMAIDYLSV